MSCVSRMFDSHRSDLKHVPHFDSLIFLNIFLCNFLLEFALASNNSSTVPSTCLLVLIWLICFCIFKLSALVFSRTFVF